MPIATHKRCGHRIQTNIDGHVKEYSSINEAKRQSRKIGIGNIVVVEKLHDITGVTKMFKAKSGHDVKAKPMPHISQ